MACECTKAELHSVEGKKGKKRKLLITQSAKPLNAREIILNGTRKHSLADFREGTALSLPNTPRKIQSVLIESS